MKLSFAKSVSIGVGLATIGPGLCATPSEIVGDSADGSSSVFFQSRVQSTDRKIQSSDDTLSLSQIEDFKWSKNREREFSDLAALKALKRATPDQLQRLKLLQVYRRKYKNPVNADDVILQYRRMKAQAAVFSALAQYERLTRASYRS